MTAMGVHPGRSPFPGGLAAAVRRTFAEPVGAVPARHTPFGRGAHGAGQQFAQGGLAGYGEPALEPARPVGRP